MTRLLPLALLIASVAVAPAVHAQTTPARRDTLPPLAPQDVEIRGQLRVRLPSIVRQPLGGIAPVAPPRRIDPQRTPDAPAYATPPLPETPVAHFVPPPTADLTAGPPLNIGLEGGLGRFLARFGRFTAAGAVAPNTRAFATVTYDGADGETLSGARRGYDDGRGTVGVHLASGRTAVEMEGTGLLRTWNAPTAAALGQIRTTGGFGSNLHVRTEAAHGLAFDVRARPSGSSTEEDVATGLNGQRLRLEDVNVPFDVRLDAPLSPVGVWVSGGGTYATRDESYNRAAFYAGAGLSGTTGITAYRAGPRVLFYDVTTAAGASERQTAVTAEVDVQAMLSPALAVRFENTPSVGITPAADVLAEAPYLQLGARFQPEAVPVDARAGATFTQGPFAVDGWAGYRMADRQRYFVSTGTTLDVGYAAVSGVQAGFGVSYTTRTGPSARAELTYRAFAFTDSTAAAATVPYLAPVTGALHLAYGLPRGGVVQLSLVGQSSRYASAGETNRLGATLDLDLYGAVSVRGPLFVIVRADRLLATGRTRFLGYPETAGVVQGGVGIRW